MGITAFAVEQLGDITLVNLEVKPGDTMIRIGLENGQNWRDIQRWNSVENPNLIEVGQVLRVIPPAGDANQVVARPVLPGSVAAAPVQPGLSNDDRPVERLKATHIAVVRGARDWQDWWRMRYPDIVQPSHHVAAFDLGGTRHYAVDVYAVKKTP